MTSGSNELTVSSGTVTFGTYTPVKIIGAGHSNSDLYSFVVNLKPLAVLL